MKGKVHGNSKRGELKDDERCWAVRRGQEEVSLWTVAACMDSGGRGSLAKNSSCLTHLVSGKTFVRKMVLFLAKKIKSGEKIVNHEKLKSIYD